MVTFFTMKNVNEFSMSMKKTSSEFIVSYFERKSTEGYKKKDIVTFLSNNLKGRGNYEHQLGYKYKET